MTESHMCTGPSCWICGEPDELRYMRRSMLGALFENREKLGISQQQAHSLSRAAAGAIREDVIKMMTTINDLENKLYFATQPPVTRVEIDPNVRVRGNQTMTGMKYVDGPVTVGQRVRVFESESGVEGDGWVSDVDASTELVYLKVIWSSLKVVEKE